MFSSRVGLCVTASIFVLLSFLALGINGRGDEPKFSRVTCTKDVTVDGTLGVILKHQVIYACEASTITWHAPNDLVFKVEFDPSDCPFESCPIIDNQHPTSPIVTHADFLEFHKYKITVNRKLFDPHVVKGGGYRESNSAGKAGTPQSQ